MIRNRVAELMDQPGIAEAQHVAALRGLRGINWISRTARIILPPVAALGRERLSLLDVASGGGDVPVKLARLARKQGIEIGLLLFDRSETALARARQLAAAADIPCRTICGDILRDPLPQADVVTNSLFLHHLDRGDVVLALSRMNRSASAMVVISDLLRSRVGLAAAWGTTRFSTSHLVRHDAPVSVRAAWRIPEMRQMAHDAGMEGASIRRCWPWRMLLVYRKGG